jgi:ketosteroid isomerase-like protein
MSQEDVEIVRAIYSLWNNGESARDLVDPELEYVNPPYAVEPGIRRGRSPLGKLREVYPDLRVEPERFVDAGQHVVVIATVRGTSVSGVKAQWRQGYVWTISDGKAIRFRWFNHPNEALEAVGLEG